MCHTVNKAGGDSTYTTTFKAEAYKFYIDQAQGLIYNPDSLPYGTDIAHVLAKTSAKNGGIVSIKSTTDESLKYFSEKDSTDFTNPRTLIVTSRDGKSYRQYKVTVNAHKQQGDVFSWSTMPASADLEQLDGHKTVAFGGKVFVFGNKDGLTHGYYTAEGDGQTWTQLPTTFAADTYKGVIAHENNLYLVENGVVKRSADGLIWTSVSSTSLARLVAETKTEIYGLSTAGTLYVSKDNGVSWAAEELDVDGVGDGLRLTSNTVLQRADVALCHADAVPTLGHDFLPTCNFLGKFVVIGMQFTGAGSQFLIELRVIVIQLTLHRIVRRNGCDGILHHLHPVG